jgi:type IV pilus assembly protein PilN
MRLDINLASQPYEDSRQFWLHWGTALGVVTILTLALLTFTVSDWFAARRDHAQIAELRAQIAQRDRKRDQAQEFLNRPENRATRDQSQFLNALIERKSLSWTHVLEDLEKVMPARVHLVSIHPEIDEDNQLTLNMVVAGDSRERAIELASRMEDSGRFTQTYIETESSAAMGSGDTVQFHINGVYITETPGAPAATRVAQATAPTPTQTQKKTKTTKTKTSKGSKP